MMIVTAKLSKSKLITIALLIVAVIVCIVLLVSSSGAAETAAASNLHNPKAKSNDDRIAFLASYGWEVESEPVQTQEVRIPKEFPDVLVRYNEVQTAQGFDLSKLAGKQVKRYVYRVTNYPDAPGEVLATLFVCKNKVVGGDISSQERGGFLHGFEKPAQSGAPPTAKAE